MTALARIVIACDHCDAITTVGEQERGINLGHDLRSLAESFRSPEYGLPRGWKHWTGNDGETYDTCPSCEAYSW